MVARPALLPRVGGEDGGGDLLGLRYADPGDGMGGELANRLALGATFVSAKGG
jgi:hypothetical protein